jgi:hypothetical protein
LEQIEDDPNEQAVQPSGSENRAVDKQREDKSGPDSLIEEEA